MQVYLYIYQSSDINYLLDKVSNYTMNSKTLVSRFSNDNSSTIPDIVKYNSTVKNYKTMTIKLKAIFPFYWFSLSFFVMIIMYYGFAFAQLTNYQHDLTKKFFVPVILIYVPDYYFRI